MNKLLLPALLCATFAAPWGIAGASDLPADPFVAQITGEWQGTGEYEGEALELTRVWSLDLLDQFLRADMKVRMSDGSTFAALLFWRPGSENRYEVLWLDGLGRRQSVEATRDANTGVVSTTFLDEYAESGPQWRTWEFEPLGADRHVERVFALSQEGRTLLAEFHFERKH